MIRPTSCRVAPSASRIQPPCMADFPHKLLLRLERGTSSSGRRTLTNSVHCPMIQCRVLALNPPQTKYCLCNRNRHRVWTFSPALVLPHQVKPGKSHATSPAPNPVTPDQKSLGYCMRNPSTYIRSTSNPLNRFPAPNASGVLATLC